MIGPYVVTTKRSCSYCWGGRPKWAGTMPAPPCTECGGSGKVVLSRLAVATIEVESWPLIGEHDPEGLLNLTDWFKALPESGGTITLPDGTVIEVEQTTWRDLVRGTGLRVAWVGDVPPAADQQRILDTFNTQEARR